MTFVMALGSALVLTTMVETRVAATFRDAAEARYAAEAALEFVVADLEPRDWSEAVAGITLSSFRDGAPSGTRSIAGRQLDVTAETNMARCATPVACSA